MGKSTTITARDAKRQVELRLDLLPSAFQTLWQNTPTYLWDWKEHQLKSKLEEECQNSPEEFALVVRARLRFWEVMKSAPDQAKAFELEDFCKGICNTQVYYLLFQEHTALLPWLLWPLTDPHLKRLEAAYLADQRMIEILSVSAVRSNGQVDARLAKAQIEIYSQLQDRIHGSVVERQEVNQKSVNVNVNSGATAEQAERTIKLITDVNELDRRIEAVKAKREALKTISGPQVIDQEKMMQPD